MNKELIDKAWACLPKEFKEEVKYKYNKTKTKKIKKECDLGFLNAHEGMFGAHNLTSDAEGEEMLTLPRKAIIQAYKKSCAKSATKYNVGYADCLYNLFGSKCLPDKLNEDNFATKKPQPAEPKNEGTHQEQCVPKNAESGTHSFSHILKDSFRKERMLNIAAQIVASMIGSDDWTTWRGGSNKEIWHNMAKSSLEIADALIAEAEKGGSK